MSCIRSGSRNLKKPTPEKSLEKYSGGVIYECKNMAQKQKKETGGYACMPLKGNIPQGKKGWKLTTCPECGEACWETPLLQSIKQSDPTLKALCTFCALRKGVN